MRLLRLVLTIAVCIPATLLLLALVTRSSSRATSGRFRALLDWRSPSALFPPSAIISLTDDNSTFFLARPASFGPALPADGLRGQLWIGSGFGDDDLSRGIASAEGELGCSDVPGWDHGDRGSPMTRHRGSEEQDDDSASSATQDSRTGGSIIQKRSLLTQRKKKKQRLPSPNHRDGTDDHLHHPLPSSSDPKSRKSSGGHADIQSIQESAEIAGKVVLLSRGGCGFLEKVKWVQRRGGKALIVGDNVRGGLLVTMYARGDTSNVTIPAIFTSYTTAHLLSSLIPSGSRSGGLNLGDVRRPGLALGSDGQLQTEGTQTAALETVDNAQNDEPGWLRFMFSRPNSPFVEPDSRRPPRSGSVDWILQEDFDQDVQTQRESAKEPNKVPAKSANSPKKPTEDGFVIGVHDWRDPDLVAFQREQLGQSVKSAATPPLQQSSSKSAAKSTFTPGMGMYAEQSQFLARASTTQSSIAQSTELSLLQETKGEPEGVPRGGPAKVQSFNQKGQAQRGQKPKPHEGLWVTLQPTNMSTSPFFDTLLVLVISPLVTLTVVYALLLLRSRIRRRRWRAPKSVVERLPVRTYHTLPGSTATTSSSQVSSVGSVHGAAPDQTTPLLQSVARPITQRPRSRTTGEVAMPGSSLSLTSRHGATPTLEEKRESGMMEWRRKYGGRQKECVVCLEEYVDGVSQVMSLPCGHEFHAECITPWLTTRRRTCPICKGDVVRTAGRARGFFGYGSSHNDDQRYDSHDDDNDDGTQPAVALSLQADARDAGSDMDDTERDAGHAHDGHDRRR